MISSPLSEFKNVDADGLELSRKVSLSVDIAPTSYLPKTDFFDTSSFPNKVSQPAPAVGL